LLKGKPTWPKAFGFSATSAFLVSVMQVVREYQGEDPMEKLDSTVAHQIAQAASAFEQHRTGHLPESVTVVLSGETLVITLHGALTPAEKALAQSPAGAAEVQNFHRQLFENAADGLRQEIKRITGAEVREAAAEVEPTTGTMVQVFTTGTSVQVYLLAHAVPASSWSGNGLHNPTS
jgi:uncharacterized protein YbcI